MYRFVLLIAATLIYSCKSNKNTSVDLSNETHSGIPALVTFLDSLQASEAIIKDDTDSLFSKINAAEIQIQMKENFPGLSLEAMQERYIHFMQSQVSEWTSEEKNQMLALFEEAKSMCDALSPRIFPGNIRLIKGKTKAYGNDAFFTRGHNIFVPESIFPIKDAEKQLPVILHELFHVISRYNEPLREDLYKLIGFVKMDKPVIVNDLLKVMVLCNPDGMSVQYGAEIETGDGVMYAVPFITSLHAKYRPEKPAYFDYLVFDVFSLGDYGDHYKVQSDVYGKSVTPLSKLPGFFNNIKDNTQYIIHPDEIMADNFMLALLSVRKNDFRQFSPEGKKLVEDVISRLRQM